MIPRANRYARTITVVTDWIATELGLEKEMSSAGQDQSHEMTDDSGPKPASQPDLSCLPDHVGRLR